MRSASEGASRGPARLSAAAAMDYLPVFLRLDGHPVVVVGGGTVALRKAAWLRRAGARVTVVAPGVHAELAQQAARGELRQIAEEFTPEHRAGGACRSTSSMTPSSRPSSFRRSSIARRSSSR